MAQQSCRHTCAESYPVEFFPPQMNEETKSVTIRATGNRVTGAYVGMVFSDKECGHFVEWEDNVALGNRHGFWITPRACPSLKLQAYRNAIGVTAQTFTEFVENFESVENGVGFLNHDHLWWPEVKLPAEWRKTEGSTAVFNASFVGLSSMTRARPDYGKCAMHWGGKMGNVVMSSGGQRTGYTRWGHDWGYVGVQVTGAGNAGGARWILEYPEQNRGDDKKTDNLGEGRKVILRGLRFAGFNREDDCGRPNVGITNSHAGHGRGRWGHANWGNYGFAWCQPIWTSELAFTDTMSLTARFDFAAGQSATGGFDRDYGFSDCTLYDQDGTLSHPDFLPPTDPSLGSKAQQAALARSALPTKAIPRLLRSASPRAWPKIYQEACQMTLDDPDWWDTGDAMNAINRCPPWLRREPDLLSATTSTSRQGVIQSTTPTTIDDLGARPDWAGKHAEIGCTPIPGTNALDCPDIDYVYLLNHVQPRRVSGSDVLYGPVGVSSCSVEGGEPTVMLVEPEEWDHTDVTGPFDCYIKDGSSGSGRAGHCLVQPSLYLVPNGACLRLDYTGDIGVFERNVFMLMGADAHSPSGVPRGVVETGHDEWNLVLEMVYMFPGTINVYFNEAFVPAKGRRNQVDGTAPATLPLQYPPSSSYECYLPNHC